MQAVSGTSTLSSSDHRHTVGRLGLLDIYLLTWPYGRIGQVRTESVIESSMKGT